MILITKEVSDYKTVT